MCAIASGEPALPFLTLSLFVALFSSPAHCVEPEATPADSSSSPTFADFPQALAAAKILYFQGDDRAAAAFEELRLRIAAGESPPTNLHADALIYLGEIYYKGGRSEDAKALFNEVLALDPDYPISPYEHPMEVVGMFEMLRRGVNRPAPRPPPPPSIKRLPVWGYSPCGTTHFRQKKNRQGTLYACLQGALAITSIASYANLQRINGVNAPPTWTDAQIQERVKLQRLGIQWPATIGFYAVWGISVFEGRRSWLNDQQPGLANGISPGEDLRVTVRHEF